MADSTGGTGNDGLQGTSGVDTLNGAAGNDTINGFEAADSLLGEAGDDSLLGLADNDTLDGGAGNDTLDGGFGHDRLVGGADSDLLRTSGSQGNDTFLGGAGNDTLEALNYISNGTPFVGEFAGSVFDGGDGVDVLNIGGSVRWRGTLANMEVINLLPASNTNGVVFEAAVLTINHGGFNSSSSPILRGTGEVNIVAGAGDSIDLSGVTHEASSSVLVSVTGTSSAETVVGTSNGDRIEGEGGADALSGGLGDDTLVGGAGNDTLDGGAGTDGAGYDGARADYLIEQVGSDLRISDLRGGAPNGVDLVRNVERFRFSDGEVSLANILTGNPVQNAGDDSRNGTSADDTIDGGAGADTINGLQGNDSLLGGTGDDSLLGLTDNDTLDGGSGADTLDGGFGHDRLIGGADSDLLRTSGSQGNDTLLGGAGNDTLSALNYTSNGTPFVGEFAGSVFDGGDGVDVLNIGGAVRWRGTLANLEVINLLPASNTAGVVFEAAVLTINHGGFNSSSSPILRGTGEVNIVAGAGDSIDLSGVVHEAGSSVLVSVTGTSSAETVVGSANGDRIEGEGGADALSGGLGDDTLVGGAGNDTLDGGAGTDGAGYDGARGDYLIEQVGSDLRISDLRGGAPNGVDLVRNVERFRFSDGEVSLANILTGNPVQNAGDDSRNGTSANDTIDGGAGNDTINGFQGSDSLLGGTGDDSLLGLTDNDTLDGGAGSDTLDGGAGADNLIGGADSDLLRTVGTQGIDTLSGGTGNDTLSALNYTSNGTSFIGPFAGSVFDGGDGTDVLSIGGEVGFQGTLQNIEVLNLLPASNSNGVVFTSAIFGVSPGAFALINGGAPIVRGQGEVAIRMGSSGTVDLTTVTFDAGANVLISVTGSAGADRAIGSSAGDLFELGDGNDSLDGRGGNDRLIGGGGDDTLDGGAGTDTLIGGAGQDLFIIGGAGDLIVDFQSGASGDRLSLAAFLTANAQGLAPGADPFAGGYLKLTQSGADALLEFDADGAAGLGGFSTLLTLKDAGVLGLTAFNLGGFAPTAVAGGASSDTLTYTSTTFVAAGDPPPVFDGGAGSDVLNIVIPEPPAPAPGQPAPPAATVRPSLDGLSLEFDLNGDGIVDLRVSAVEDIVLNGQKVVISGDLSNTGLAPNTITYTGGATDDLYDGSGVTSVESVRAEGLGGNDTILSTGGGDTLNGGAGNDILRSAAGADSLFGGTGSDTLEGGDDADTIDGGSGSDSVDGGAGADILIFSGARSDYFIETAGVGLRISDQRGGQPDGVDLVVNVETFRFAGGDVALANILTGNPQPNTGGGGGGGGGGVIVLPSNTTPSAGPDSLVGTAGADVFDGNEGDDSLNGGAGNDFIRGLADNDTVFGGDGDDTINGNAGNDSVFGGPGVDIVYGGQGADYVDGGEGDDSHANGNMGSDTVHGGAGNDTVYGGQGNDSVYGDEGDDRLSGDLGDDNLFGGAGADRFVLGRGFGHDWAIDFNFAEGDRVLLAPGTSYTVRNHAGQVLLELSDGSTLGLAGVNPSAFSSDWVVFG